MSTKKTIGIVLFIGIIAFFFIWQYSNNQKPIDFSTDVKPILNKNCISCHGGVKKDAGFSFLFEEEALGNTKSGKPAIIPGNAYGSEMIKRINYDDPEIRMPYKKAKLSKKDIETLTRWVDEGAKWGEHWAYNLSDNIEKPNHLDNEDTFIINGIDNFILEKLNNEGLTPNPIAQNNVLARRVSLDITGLPANQSDIDKMNSGSLSYENYIDQLLNKPTFGEKWASWWLDMARYADSKGYEADHFREMWPYRDWVIKAFNKDMPFDQFTIEQLSGDLLSKPTIDQYIATGFHRNTMNNDEGGTDDEEFRIAAVMDRVNTTFEVWQSTTIGCVQCHSHPYDPYKHKNYYELMAFFNNSRDEDIPYENPVLKFYSPEQQKKVDLVNHWILKYGNKKTATTYKNFMLFNEPIYNSHLMVDFKNGVFNNHDTADLWDDGSCVLKNVWTQEASYMYLSYRSEYDNTKLTIREGDANGKVLASTTLSKTKKENRSYKRLDFTPLKSQVDLYFEASNNRLKKEDIACKIHWVAFLEDIPGKEAPNYSNILNTFTELLHFKTPTLPIMIDNPDYMKRNTQVFERGNWLLKADTVQPATPDFLNTWNPDWPRNRFGLSKWLIDKKNPLTARTLVNRIWFQIYGTGLVTTIEDMGSQSDAPSHPELLDWLSIRLMHEHDWSIKSLIKDIVLSGTYRQSSESTPQNYISDPANNLYARGPRLRLSSEEIRDQALSVSGLLSPKMYGPSVMPPQPEGVWQTVYNKAKWEESKGDDKYRRAIYTYLKRTSPYPSFITFDSSSREICTVRRTTTNTPLQALTTLNDPVYVEAAYHFAKIINISDDFEKNIQFGYEKAILSEIKPETLDVLKQLYQTSFTKFQNDPKATKSFLYFEEHPSVNLAALTVVSNAIMNLDEFLTKA